MLCQLPFFFARDVMQRVRVTSTIPTMFEAAAVDHVSGAPFTQWFFQSYRDCWLPWSTHHCDAGSVFNLAQVFVVLGRTQSAGHTPALVYCHKIRRMTSNQVDDTSNLYFELSTPISSAAVQTVMDFDLVDADDGHDAVRLP
ncbi:hypothetical protein MRX96_044687 [Rhipicephalus microplus]